MEESPVAVPAAVSGQGLSWRRFVLELPVPADASLVTREFMSLKDEPLAYFARAGFRFLIDHLRANERRELGHALAEEATPDKVPLFLAAWATAGLGHVDMQEDSPGKFRFTSADLLLEAEGAKTPACAIALGFMEGLARAATGRDALGSEVQCRAMGHPACVFMVKSR